MKTCDKHTEDIEYESGACPECFLTELLDDGAKLMKTQQLVITPMHKRLTDELMKDSFNSGEIL